MLALTIRQPWADQVIRGEKKIENRTRRLHYRGPLLIHAAKIPGEPCDGLALGCIVGLVEAVGCVPVEDVADDPHAEGPFCWLLAQVVRLPDPVPCKGKLGLWQPPRAVLRRVLRQLAPAP